MQRAVVPSFNPAVVLDALAEDSGIARARLVPTARLREDLGLSTDASWGLFATLETRFETDIGAVSRHLHAYFPVDRRVAWSSPWILFTGIVGGGLLSRSARWSWWTSYAVTITLALAIVALTRWRRRRPPRTLLPVTVAMLLAAAAEGEWCDPRLGDIQASSGI